MRVLVAATSSRGGAGIAAYRSYTALIECGVESSFLSLDYLENNVNLQKAFLKRLIGEILRKSLTLFQSKFIQNSSKLMTPISFNSFKWMIGIQPDFYQVLHLHAFYNLVNVKEISQLCKKFPRVVLTLHDERTFTGGCHYAGDCAGFKFECSKCPLVHTIFRTIPSHSLQKSIQSLKTIKNLEIIAPSDWIAKRAKSSNVLKNKFVHVVSNPIPDLFFEKTLRKRDEIGKLVLGFNSFSLENPFKGFAILTQALSLLKDNDKQRIILKIATRSIDIPTIPNVHLEMESPNSDLELKDFYKKIDLLIVPSTEDNSPNVIGEALASGVSVLGSNVGGIPEMLEKFNQIVFKSGDAKELSNQISWLISKKLPDVDSKRAIATFSNKAYVENVLKLYQS